MGQRPDIPPLPYRARPPQVLLGVGALLVVSCAAALAGALGGEPARIGLLLAAAAAAAGAVGGAGRPLPGSAETLAACAVALALIGGGWGRSRATDVAGLLAVAAGCGLLHLAAARTAAGALGGWLPRGRAGRGAGPRAGGLASQLAALRTLPAVPERAQAALFLGVALAGV